MIFSFSNSSIQKINIEINQTDIFCFFYSENAIFVPEQVLLQAVVASLKMKKNVLILEEHFGDISALDTSKRWQAEGEFLWLAPRSLSVLLEARHEISDSYKCMKNYLFSRK